MKHFLIQPIFLCVFVFLMSYNALALGTNISFESAQKNSEGNIELTYNYGFSGKRVLHDDDGNATLIALLANLKGEYIRAQNPSGNQTLELDGLSSSNYRALVSHTLTRLGKGWDSGGYCGYSPETCQGIGGFQKFIRTQSGPLKWSEVFRLSEYLQKVDGDDYLQPVYSTDRYDGGKIKDTVDDNTAAYMLSTDNLSPWIPSGTDVLGSRCSDSYSTGAGFLSQLYQANLGDSGAREQGTQTGRQQNSDR